MASIIWRTVAARRLGARAYPPYQNLHTSTPKLHAYMLHRSYATRKTSLWARVSKLEALWNGLSAGKKTSLRRTAIGVFGGITGFLGYELARYLSSTVSYAFDLAKQKLKDMKPEWWKENKAQKEESYWTRLFKSNKGDSRSSKSSGEKSSESDQKIGGKVGVKVWESLKSFTEKMAPWSNEKESKKGDKSDKD